jgi:hypothetical protein
MPLEYNFTERYTWSNVSDSTRKAGLLQPLFKHYCAHDCLLPFYTIFASDVAVLTLNSTVSWPAHQVILVMIINDLQVDESSLLMNDIIRAGIDADSGIDCVPNSTWYSGIKVGAMMSHHDCWDVRVLLIQAGCAYSSKTYNQHRNNSRATLNYFN